MKIDKPLLKSLLIMADIIEARDPYTGGHVWRVSQFARLLATKIGLSEDEIIKISIAAPAIASWNCIARVTHSKRK